MSQDESQILFTLSTTSLSHLSNVLSCITPVGSKCLVVINEKGLFFIINEINICKVQLNLDANFFDTFVFHSGDDIDAEGDSGSKNIRFGIDIHSLLESVTIANSYTADVAQQQQQQLALVPKTNCVISYRGYGYPFVLSFEDELMLERVEFQTFNIQEDEDEELSEGFFEIDNDKLILEMIIKSSIVYQILKDLKEIQTEQIFIYCDTKDDVPNLIFISKGELGFSKLMFPRKKSLLEEMTIHKMVKRKSIEKHGYSFPEDDEYDYIKTNKDTITCFYNFNYFIKLLKLARLASKIKFKKDGNGLTSIILLLKDDNKRSNNSSTTTTVIEFKLLEFINPNSDQDDSVSNNNFNNSYIQNLIDDDDVIELQLNLTTEQQQLRLDDLLPLHGEMNGLEKVDNDNILANSTVVNNNNIQVNETVYNQAQSNKKRKRDDGIDIVGGAIEHPIFL